jgi:N-acetylglucosaminyl-diphospho-decaprenol L-rhamnosyltransferase
MGNRTGMSNFLESPLLSIVIPYFRGFDELTACLLSLKENLGALPFEVIVVENGSGDDSASLIAGDFPWVTLIVNSENRFFARAANQGAKEATGRYLLILNSDTEIVGDALQKMMDYLDKAENAKVGLCTCKICLADGTPERLNRYAVGIMTFIIRFTLLEKALLKRCFPAFYEALHKRVYYSGEERQPEAQEVLSGQALLFRRSVFEALGGFDERYRLWFTDDEICHRVTAQGYQPVLLPCEKIIHRQSSSIKRLPGAQKIIESDTALYLKERFGLPGFLLCYACFKADRLMRQIVRSIRSLCKRS